MARSCTCRHIHLGVWIEPAHNGKAAWSAAQRDAYVKCCAAINRKVGNDGSHTIAQEVSWAAVIVTAVLSYGLFREAKR